mmetsp:Transcript_68346/g.152553  ORF Transcript_68346/g.152553 Transcript_68346/m.152553 type:complete len:204 (-) Transcript_68346:304-915(-)
MGEMLKSSMAAKTYLDSCTSSFQPGMAGAVRPRLTYSPWLSGVNMVEAPTQQFGFFDGCVENCQMLQSSPRSQHACWQSMGVVAEAGPASRFMYCFPLRSTGKLALPHTSADCCSTVIAVVFASSLPSTFIVCHCAPIDSSISCHAPVGKLRPWPLFELSDHAPFESNFSLKTPLPLIVSTASSSSQNLKARTSLRWKSPGPR